MCRHGHCSRDGVECPYEHDPLRVAICVPFLHGCCEAGAACALSHEPTAERMPVCRLYQRGLCVAAACDFSHIHRGSTAELCEAFSRGGYCPDGERCAKRHEMACELAARGACPLGDRCKLGRGGAGGGRRKNNKGVGGGGGARPADELQREDSRPLFERRGSIVPDIV